MPLDECWVLPYNRDHFWDGTWYYGMSYLAAVKLCRDNGYRIYDVVNNTNVIAIRDDYYFKPIQYSFGMTWSHPETNRKFLDLNKI